MSLEKNEISSGNINPLKIESFSDLPISREIQDALVESGYKKPSPIQSRAILPLLEGKDIVGQAQTGTGKTAAFAIPMLENIDLSIREVQIIVLAPTRELAIQVADSFKRYGKNMRGLKVLPIYGGQDYDAQFRPLKNGVHVVVGTPGRVMDHMRRGTLHLNSIRGVVLDEADEMLKMGFFEDMEWILSRTPPQKQVALFSATMPAPIRKIAHNFLNSPEEIFIKTHSTAAESIEQRCYLVDKLRRVEAITRILESETYDGVLIFVRKKITTLEITEDLVRAGYHSVALNGDMAQNSRELTVRKFKNGASNILVATEVAARGLDLPRISHVINYDPPEDPEIYVHRIGRTGRAGRTGVSILFLSKRESRKFLGSVERVTKQHINIMPLPTHEDLNKIRITNFKRKIAESLRRNDIEFFANIVTEYSKESGIGVNEIAGALAFMAQGSKPILMDTEKDNINRLVDDRPYNDEGRRGRGRDRASRSRDDRRGDRTSRSRNSRNDRSSRYSRDENHESGRNSRDDRNTKRDNFRRESFHKKPGAVEQGMERYKIDLGHDHRIKPGNIVGAIAGESGLDGSYIGRIDIYDEFSYVDLPEGIPQTSLKKLEKARISGLLLNIRPVSGSSVTEGKSSRPRSQEKRNSRKNKKNYGSSRQKKKFRK